MKFARWLTGRRKRREFLPISESLLAHIKREPQLSILCSFPRSGTRWLRKCFYYAAAEILDTDDYQIYTPQSVHCDTPDPKFIRNEVIVDAYNCPIPVTCERPDLFSKPVYRSHNLSQIAELKQHRLVYTYRDPVASLNSWLHRLNQKNPKKTRSLESICEQMLPSWIEQMQLAISLKKAEPERILILKYSTDYPFTDEALIKASKFLELPFSTQQINRASVRLREYFEQLNADPTQAHQRASNIGSEKDYDPKLLKSIRSQTQALMEQMDALDQN